MDTGNQQQRIVTTCPACGNQTLFIGSGGHLTCSWLKCKSPSVAMAVEEYRIALGDALSTLVALGAQPSSDGRLWVENPTVASTLAHVRRALGQPDPPDPLRVGR
jgi:hypothetical protein